MMNQAMQNDYHIWVKKWEVTVGVSDMPSDIDSPTPQRLVKYKMLHSRNTEETDM